MNLVTKKNTILFLICLLILIPAISLAHGMLLELESPGVLKVEYDGGGFSPRTMVTIYDKDGNELESGAVDEDGKYKFDTDLDVHKAVADDGMGHRAEYEEGVENKSIPKLPVVIGVFVLIGIIFIFYNKKQKAK